MLLTCTRRKKPDCARSAGTIDLAEASMPEANNGRDEKHGDDEHPRQHKMHAPETRYLGNTRQILALRSHGRALGQRRGDKEEASPIRFDVLRWWRSHAAAHKDPSAQAAKPWARPAPSLAAIPALRIIAGRVSSRMQTAGIRRSYSSTKRRVGSRPEFDRRRPDRIRGEQRVQGRRTIKIGLPCWVRQT